MEPTEIISKLPYAEPFLFVNEIEHVSKGGIRGNYTFPNNSFFYQGHFKNKPVTPGVILIECMAQIGVVAFGLFLLKDDGRETSKKNLPKIAMSSTKIEFFQTVFPGEKVTVVSEKIYSRFNKLKCAVKMYNEKQKIVCKGEIAGMLK